MKILKFSALWCSSCLVMKPRYKEIETLYSNIEVIDYDYDFDEEMVNKYNIGSLIPVLIIVDDLGNEKTRIIGEKTVDQIKKVIEEIK